MIADVNSLREDEMTPFGFEVNEETCKMCWIRYDGNYNGCVVTIHKETPSERITCTS